MTCDDPTIWHGYSLCQDCIAVREVAIFRTDDREDPPCDACGGDTCVCGDCDATARMLLDGERDGFTLGMQHAGHVGPWTPERGTGPWQGPKRPRPEPTPYVPRDPRPIPDDIDEDDIPF